jgi:hypothetical protein
VITGIVFNSSELLSLGELNMRYKTEQAYLLNWAKKIKAVSFLGGQCVVCGNSDFRVLDIHHKEKEDKNFTFNAGKYMRWSTMVEELKRCSLLCRNHHSEIHFFGEIGWKDNLLSMAGVDRCHECGYRGSNSSSLDFHHIGEKSFGISDGYKRDKLLVSIEIILSEIDKCEILCRNCHCLRHLDKDRLEKMMPRILHKVSTYREIQKAIDVGCVQRLRRQGNSLSEIARVLGCHKSTVSLLLKRYGC